MEPRDDSTSGADGEADENPHEDGNKNSDGHCRRHSQKVTTTVRILISLTQFDEFDNDPDREAHLSGVDNAVDDGQDGGTLKSWTRRIRAAATRVNHCTGHNAQNTSRKGEDEADDIVTQQIDNANDHVNASEDDDGNVETAYPTQAAGAPNLWLRMGVKSETFPEGPNKALSLSLSLRSSRSSGAHP